MKKEIVIVEVPQKTFDGILNHAAAGYEVCQQLKKYGNLALAGEKITNELAESFEEHKF